MVHIEAKRVGQMLERMVEVKVYGGGVRTKPLQYGMICLWYMGIFLIWFLSRVIINTLLCNLISVIVKV